MDNMQVTTAHPIVDGVLHRHRAELGESLATYRNHVYRCLNYQQLLLHDGVPDEAALAWAVHDLGIWTAGTFDYLQPSADLASAHADEFGIADVAAARRMVTEHHKLRRTTDRVTETFRVADLVDVSRGVLAGGIERDAVKTVVVQLPYLGFHMFLAKGLAAHAVRHPANPLPMMRW
jgi:hypothetical protein